MEDVGAAVADDGLTGAGEVVALPPALWGDEGVEDVGAAVADDAGLTSAGEVAEPSAAAVVDGDEAQADVASKITAALAPITALIFKATPVEAIESKPSPS